MVNFLLESCLNGLFFIRKMLPITGGRLIETVQDFLLFFHVNVLFQMGRLKVGVCSSNWRIEFNSTLGTSSNSLPFRCM